MNVCFCDLCQQPINGKRHILLLLEDADPVAGRPTTKVKSAASYEVCSSCVVLLLRIFSLKKKRVAEIEQFLDETYQLPVKKTRVKKT